MIRLIGTYQLPNYVDQVSEETVISEFKKNNTFFYPASTLTFNFFSSIPPLTNNRDWQFSASMGQIDITQYTNDGIAVSYSFAQVILNNSQIVDFNGNTFPSTIFPNITFMPRCL